MHDPAIENLGILARTTHDRAIGKPSTYAEALIRRATAYEQAQREMMAWKPYEHANILPDPKPFTRKMDWTMNAAAVIAVAVIGVLLWL